MRGGYSCMDSREWLIVRSRGGSQVSMCFECSDFVIEGDGKRIVLAVAQQDWAAAVAQALGRLGFTIADDWIEF
jgi:hypothetical protein